MEFVFSRHKGLARQESNLFRNELRKALGSIESRADSRSAESKLIKRLYRHAEKLRVSFKA